MSDPPGIPRGPAMVRNPDGTYRPWVSPLAGEPEPVGLLMQRLGDLRAAGETEVGYSTLRSFCPRWAMMKAAREALTREAP